jgi:O-acetyl-ADP-ribose deacetylase (regulator of RNase III)
LLQEMEGDLFGIGFPAIGHGCNCLGVMGAGIAVEFRRRYPDMYEEYRTFCKAGLAEPGDVLPYDAADGTVIYNLLTQPLPGATATVAHIVAAMARTIEDCKARSIGQLGIPRIGAGHGGLKWEDVREGLKELMGGDPFSLVIVSLPGSAGAPHADVAHLSRFSHPLKKVVDWGSYSPNNEIEVVDPQDADIITSKVMDFSNAPGLIRHTVMLDLDVAAMLVPSSTAGHSHLYIDVPMMWQDYEQLLILLARVNILESGYVRASQRRGATALRLPWVRKGLAGVTLFTRLECFDICHRLTYTVGERQTRKGTKQNVIAV